MNTFAMSVADTFPLDKKLDAISRALTAFVSKDLSIAMAGASGWANASFNSHHNGVNSPMRRATSRFNNSTAKSHS